jgi:polyisoprenoid-binding protein YceI
VTTSLDQISVVMLIVKMVSMRLFVLRLVAPAVLAAMSQAQAPSEVPVYEITPESSTIQFDVESSVDIKGIFDKWDAKLTFTSTDATTAVLEIKIQADSVDTGSRTKNGKLKGKDFFDTKRNPLITFKSTRVVQTGPDNFEADGDFTIRGVTRPEKLSVTVSGRGTGSGAIKGVMAFDRKQYGMNSGIPFIRIADRVEVTVDLKANSRKWNLTRPRWISAVVHSPPKTEYARWGQPVQPAFTTRDREGWTTATLPDSLPSPYPRIAAYSGREQLRRGEGPSRA